MTAGRPEIGRTRAGDPGAILAIDSSTAALAIAVLSNGIVIGSVQSEAERNHSRLIIPEIKRLMAECGMKPQDLDAIAVGQGPGSYTGVRIAVTAGKTLAWAWNKKLVGVSSLEALAFGAWEAAAEADTAGSGDAAQCWIVPAQDARRGQVYTSRFLAGRDGDWTRLDADGIRLSSDWAQQLRQEAAASGSEIEIWFVGHTDPFADEPSDEAGGPGPLRARHIPFEVEAGAIGKLAVRRMDREETDDIHAFVPNYTQLAEAEAKLLAAARRDSR